MEHKSGTFGAKDSSDGRFVYHVELPTLQTIASFQIAISLWRSHLSRWTYNRAQANKKNIFYWDWKAGRRHEDNVYRKYDIIDKLIYFLKTPKRIEKMLETSLEKVHDEMKKWTKYISKKHYVSNYNLEWCVWLPNGEIDYRKSAINALNSGHLDEIEKFSIMYQYCLEDEIGQTVWSDEISEYYFEDVNFEHEPLLFYWACFLKNKLHEIPLGNFTSIAGSVAGSEKFHSKESTVLEYFWHRMTPDDQRLVMVSWISRAREFRVATLERLFATMPWSQQVILLSAIPEKIIIELGIKKNSPKIGLWAWNHCKDTVTMKQFESMFDTILRLALEDDQKMRLVIEIWDTAAEFLKNRRNVVDTWKYYFNRDRQSWLRWCRSVPCPTVFEFFYKMCRSPDKRCSSLRCFCGSYDFAISLVQDISDLSSLIDIFIAYPHNSTERSQFQKMIQPKMENHCISLLNVGNFDNLQCISEWFTGGDVHETQSFYQEFLYFCPRRFRRRTCLENDINKWKKLCELFDFVYPENSSRKYTLKFKFVSLLGLRCGYGVQFRNNVDKMIKIMNEEFAKRDLAYIKSCFFYSFNRRFRFPAYWQYEYECDEKFIEKFIKWCLNDDQEEIFEFKRNVALTIIYDRILDGLLRDNSVVRAAFVNILLGRLEKYLIWCLETKENVKEFKIRRMNRPDRDLQPFRVLSREPDEHTLQILLNWCFDGDKVAIRTFRSRRIKKLRKIPDKIIHIFRPYLYEWHEAPSGEKWSSG